MQPGTAVLHYEILAPLGKGGMGEVWRARDAKLGREVAIKVLPDAFTKDPERLARFEREAHLLASLDHVHIAAIHGFEEADGVRFLVMQLAEGEDLADRMLRGPIPIDEALAIAKQIASALESAHDHGIVHRDLKPSNIRIDEDGRIRILDFGLAKALESEESDEDFSNSPTMVRAATHAGVILGTAAYMSPEQARGKRVDKRADIWAFGVVLWEMLAGRQLFGADTVSDTLASVLKEQPDWSELPDDVPASVRRLLRRCLAKNPRDRLRDIGDALLELETTDTEDAGQDAPVSTRRSVLPWVIAVAAVLLAVVVLLWPGGNDEPQTRQARHLRLPLEPAAQLGENPSVAISPDGDTIVYRGEVGGSTMLLTRTLSSGEVTVIPGSEEATRAAFSADGSSIVFGARGNIFKQSLATGVPAIVARESVANGICWSASGTFVFNSAWATGLRKVADSGGAAEPLTTADPGTSHVWPHCLPDGEHVLFTRWSGESADAIAVQAVSLSTGEVTEVIRNAKAPRFHRSGILTFVRGETLMAVRFDPKTLTTTGNPVTLVSGVSYDLGNLGASYDLSDDGTLIYVPASQKASQNAVWVDAAGTELDRIDPGLEEWGEPQISPDGSKLLLTERGPAFQLWIIDLEGGPRTQLTRRDDNGEGIWTPDGESIIFTSNRNGNYQLLRQRIDGTAQPEVLLADYGTYPDPQDISRDGKALLFLDNADGSSTNLQFLPLDGSGKARQLETSPGAVSMARFSPDGRYVAFSSAASGRPEIYVTPFPGPGAVWQITSGGGLAPEWSPDGRFLYFVDGTWNLARVRVDLSAGFRSGAPEPMFALDSAGRRIDEYHVSVDGTRFLFREARDRTPFSRLNVVLNWIDTVEKRLP